MTLARVLPFALLTLSGCVPTSENAGTEQNVPDHSGNCDASTLDYAVGKTLTKELEARLKSEAKASVVRIAPHDGAITMDYNPVRLNIFTGKTGNIIRINCG